MADPRADVIAEMRDSFERLQTMVADLHPTDEADPAKAEMIAALSQAMVPSVRTMRRLSGGRCSSQNPTSRLTHSDWAAAGDASRTKYSDDSSPF